MSQFNVNAVVHAALIAAHSYGDRIAELRTHYQGKAQDEVRTALLPIVASFDKYQVPVIDGKGKAKGSKVLDKAHANYEACKKALQRLTADICGDAAGKTEEEEIEIPEEILAAAAALAALCQEYEGARKLASKAVALAFATE